MSSAATLGRRVGAYLIDGAIAFVVMLIAVGIFAGISFGTGGAFPLLLAGIAAEVVLVAWLVVYTLMQGGGGSLGMRALGLRLGRAEDGTRLGFGRALGRNLIWGLGGAIVVGYFSPLFDGSPWHRGWHDKASGAVMTDVAGRGVAVPDRAGGGGAQQQDAAVPAPAASPAAASVPTALPAAPILPMGEDTELAGWTPAGPSASPRPAPQASGVISFVPGVTDPTRYSVPELVEGPPPPPPPAVPVVEVARSPLPVPELVEGSPAASGSVPESLELLEETRISTGPQPAARIVWDDGARQALHGRTIFGRNPAPETGAMVTPVRDETLSLSKTHFELIPDAAAAPGAQRALWVIDRHSTNGVVIRRGTQRQSVVPGERTRVHRGDVLEFGDRTVSIEVAP